MKKIFFVSICTAISFLQPNYAGARSGVNNGKLRPVNENNSFFIRSNGLLTNYDPGISFNNRFFKPGFQVFGDTILLPMTLMDFNVHQSGHDCYLGWKGVREEYTHGYTIERSIDGKSYADIGTTAGPGHEFGMIQFSYTDLGAANLGARVVFYRLRQVNAEGKNEYTHVLAVTVTNSGNFADLFPNPATDRANLVIHVSQEERVDWNLTDLTGRTLKFGQYKVTPGASRINIDVKGLPSGLYLMQLKSLSVSGQLKLLKL